MHQPGLVPSHYPTQHFLRFVLEIAVRFKPVTGIFDPEKLFRIIGSIIVKSLNNKIAYEEVNYCEDDNCGYCIKDHNNISAPLMGSEAPKLSKYTPATLEEYEFVNNHLFQDINQSDRSISALSRDLWLQPHRYRTGRRYGLLQTLPHRPSLTPS